MDLLNLDRNDFIDERGSSSFSDPNIFNPNPNKGKDGLYKAIIRFLPWWKDPKTASRYRKYTVILTHPLTKEKLVIDCPSTIAKRQSFLMTLDIMLKKIKDEEPEMVKSIREGFNRFENWTSPVFIVKDPQVKENENKIFLYNYGYTIKKMQDDLLKPIAMEGMEGMESSVSEEVNPFSLTDGKDFLLVVKKKNKYGKEYVSSKFLKDKTPFRFPVGNIEDGKVFVCKKYPTDDENRKASMIIAKYLEKNTPNIESYFFKEWTEKDYKNVANMIVTIIPYKNFLNEVLEQSKDHAMNEAIREALAIRKETAMSGVPTSSAPKHPVAKPAETNVDEYNLSSEFPGEEPEDTKPARTEAPVAKKPAAASSSDDEFDDILAGM